MQYRLGVLSLGAYDMTGQKLVRFDATPAFSRDGTYNPVWISDTELMFSALPAGQEPDMTSVRAHSGQALTKAWQGAWGGKMITASEVRSSMTDQSDQAEPGKLVRANARTGRITVVADGAFADLRVSPDRLHLAALSMSRPRPTAPGSLVEDDPRRYRLTLFDLATNAARPLAVGIEFFPYTLIWSPDGRRVAGFGWRRGEGPRQGRFYSIDSATGAVVRYEHRGLDLTSERERGWLQRPERAMFLGDDLAVFARPIPAVEDQAPRLTYRDVGAKGLPRADWYALSSDGHATNLSAGLSGVSGVPVHSGIGQITVVADDGVYRLRADGSRRRLTPALPGRFRLLMPGTFATRDSVIRPEFGDEAMVAVNGTGSARIVMVDLRAGHEGANRVIDAPSADAAPLAGSLASRAVLFRADVDSVSRLLVARQGNAPREIARINAHFADIDLGRWQAVSYEVPQAAGQPATKLESCVLLPPGFDPAVPPPLVVEVYPDVGPRCGNGGERITYPNAESPYLWAGRGYAYARLTTPRALIRTADGPIAGMPKAVDTGIDAIAAKGLIDPKRVALYGFSQGGISALYTAAHSTHFRAVIAMNSWADLFSHYFGPNGVYSSVYGEYFGDFARYDSVAGSDFGMGRTPFEDPEIYIRNSPVFLAPKIAAPVMLIHSDMDGFSMYQFDEMYGALTRAGKEVRYVRYWGEGHGPSSPANIRDMWQRIDQFLKDSGVAPKSAN